MKLARLLLLASLSLVLGGCATRGAIRISCEGFRTYVTTPRPSPLVRDIQSDTEAPITLSVALQGNNNAALTAADIGAKGSPLGEGIEALILRNARKPDPLQLKNKEKPRPAGILLLSGGGQWGAFGAGFLKSMQTGFGGRKAVDFGTITGVSTGGLQSLFVAIDKLDANAYEQLSLAYKPEREKDVVNQNAKVAAVLTGSFAGLKPLRRKIEAALCINGDAKLGCPMIDQLARSGRHVLIGFVNAETGAFEYADAVAIARSAAAGEGERKNAQQCLTGVALASAAMPVFFQQVQIEGVTYYDGGVRQSVFEEEIGATIEQAVAAATKQRTENPQLHAEMDEPVAPPLYVIRNGPTQLLTPKGVPGPDDAANKGADALTAAQRAEAILVNQMEVGSIASLRLAHPTGEIWLVTADGFHAWKARAGDPSPPAPTPPQAVMGCPKDKKFMFQPAFMRCLQAFGAFKADRAKAWQSLAPLKVDQSAPSAGPALVPAP